MGIWIMVVPIVGCVVSVLIVVIILLFMTIRRTTVPSRVAIVIVVCMDQMIVVVASSSTCSPATMARVSVTVEIMVSCHTFARLFPSTRVVVEHATVRNDPF